jgi:glutamine synthetase
VEVKVLLLDINVANVVANAMKDWAVERGATHYTHWFQPMTGITAEKHDSFISPTPDGGSSWSFRARSWSAASRRLLLPLGRPARHL